MCQHMSHYMPFCMYSDTLWNMSLGTLQHMCWSNYFHTQSMSYLLKYHCIHYCMNYYSHYTLSQ